LRIRAYLSGNSILLAGAALLKHFGKVSLRKFDMLFEEFCQLGGTVLNEILPRFQLSDPEWHLPIWPARYSSTLSPAMCFMIKIERLQTIDSTLISRAIGARSRASVESFIPIVWKLRRVSSIYIIPPPRRFYSNRESHRFWRYAGAKCGTQQNARKESQKLFNRRSIVDVSE